MKIFLYYLVSFHLNFICSYKTHYKHHLKRKLHFLLLQNNKNSLTPEQKITDDFSSMISNQKNTTRIDEQTLISGENPSQPLPNNKTMKVSFSESKTNQVDIYAPQKGAISQGNPDGPGGFFSALKPGENRIKKCNDAVMLSGSRIRDASNFTNRSLMIFQANMFTFSIFQSQDPSSLEESIDVSHISRIAEFKGAPECLYIESTEENKMLIPCFNSLDEKMDIVDDIALWSLCRAGISITDEGCSDGFTQMMAKFFGGLATPSTNSLLSAGLIKPGSMLDKFLKARMVSGLGLEEILKKMSGTPDLDGGKVAGGLSFQRISKLSAENDRSLSPMSLGISSRPEKGGGMGAGMPGNNGDSGDALSAGIGLLSGQTAASNLISTFSKSLLLKLFGFIKKDDMRFANLEDCQGSPIGLGNPGGASSGPMGDVITGFGGPDGTGMMSGLKLPGMPIASILNGVPAAAGGMSSISALGPVTGFPTWMQNVGGGLAGIGPAIASGYLDQAFQKYKAQSNDDSNYVRRRFRRRRLR